MIKNCLLILLLAFCACKTGEHLKGPIPAQNEKWMEQLNQRLKMHSCYTQKAGLFLDNEMKLEQEAINEALQKFRAENGGIRFVESMELVEHDSLRFFDLGHFEDKHKKDYYYLIAWNKMGGQWKKEMEFIHTSEKSSALKKEAINAARKQWIRLSNAQDHRALIEQSYTADAIYFNNGKADQGTEEIIARYAYMSDPGWQINLIPIKVFSVAENMVYEIGQYQSNGIGHYVIVWVQNERKEWQVRFDFNF